MPDWAIRALFTDGGLIGRNGGSDPAKVGTWAFCLLDDEGNRQCERSGIILAETFGLDRVTNNLSELFAMIRGLEALPRWWAGPIHCDSDITLMRLFNEAKLNGIPEDVRIRFNAAKRRVDLHNCIKVLVAGHPTGVELEQGFKMKGLRRYPVSPNNVWCDDACNYEREKYEYACSNDQAALRYMKEVLACQA